MNDTVLPSADRAEKLQGLGCKRRRVEDARFIQGKGNYVDDLKLPGMLYGDFARSPYAHARIRRIDAAHQTAHESCPPRPPHVFATGAHA